MVDVPATPATNAPRPPKGYGIDFGTTNSVVAVCDPADRSLRAFPLLDRETGHPHPSVVWFQGDQPIVGAVAKNNFNAYVQLPGNRFVRSVKRLLGKRQAINIFGQSRPVSDVASEIFAHLKHDAEEGRSDRVSEAVVTIPVYFDGHARRELRDAARKAGIHVKTFIHEPFAAVVGYCASQGRSLQQLDKTRVLVFDWGGGTLDITVARIEDGKVWELTTGGLNGIAGDLFDQRLQDYAFDRFVQEYRLDRTKIELAPGAKDRLVIEAERVKIALSTDDEAEMSVGALYSTGGHEYDLIEPVNRSQFEVLISDCLDAAMHEVDRVLEVAGLTPADIEVALLIGGTSRIPRLRQRMLERFGSRIVDVENADTVIAEGAAIIAARSWQPYLAKSISVRLADRSHYTVFPADTVLHPDLPPKDLTFFCTDNRSGEARLILCEQEWDGDPHSEVQKLVVPVPVSRDLPRPYNHERVYASIRIDNDLVIQVTANGATQGRPARGEIHDICFGLRGV